MQQLLFEDAWDRTIADEDRAEIIRLFTESADRGERFIPVRAAINHRGDLLVTAIVQNTSTRVSEFKNKQVVYEEAGELVAEHLFSVDQLNLPPETSMPWTLIFPIRTIQEKPQLNGLLRELNG
ncbi:SLAP domain-containing protein [Bacillus sp. JCM 19041]|uniref:SLAP domain-containing protein n=1 Tax=Bacillus sp. JCM 19041 TaxID=1460637 RepID=UPI0006D076D1